MAYDKDFYKAYQSYLKEKTVRQAHDWIFSIFSDIDDRHEDVVDLGCGSSQEFWHYYKPIYYTGVDLNVEKLARKYSWFKVGNYRSRSFLKSVIDKNHSAFVSLFSSEITAPYTENYHLYNWIFRNFPKIQAGLVSGFYYTNRTNKIKVEETGGVVSYQTLERIEDASKYRRGYTERRIELPVPSKMFGDKVIEVWKIFNRT